MSQHGSAASQLCDINVLVLRRTDKAALVEPAFRKGEPTWVPLSQVELSRNDGADTFLLAGPHWLFAQKGWL